MSPSHGNPGPKAPTRGILHAVFTVSFGALLGLCLVKFGNPVVMEKYVESPGDIYQWIFNAWPAVIAHWLLAAVVCLGLAVAQWNTRKVPLLLLGLPAAWLLWEFAAATHTVSARLTNPTLVHFTACVVCFYLGFFALAPARRPLLFWTGLLGAFLIVLALGFQQHFGGLEQTRRFFYLYELPKLKEPPPPEFFKKISTNRIFSTLFYPNTLAGAILLLLPPILAMLWSLERLFTIGARRFSVGAVGLAALACLFWSGSKGGWLLMLAVAFVAVLFVPFDRRIKVVIVSTVLVLGLAGFAAKYAGFFRRGATSVVARFDYWRAALEVVKERPVFGTGPGTFEIPYERLKKPESEMARLTHNDYLQQASDSGVPGFLLFTGFVVAGLVYTYRKAGLRSDWLRLGVWLGLLGWALQSLMEFDLYIPAIAWPAFCLMGWLLGISGNQFDTRRVSG